MQAPPQLISLPGQETVHEPAEQTLPPVHAIPADPDPAPHPSVAPQNDGFVLGSTQVPPQFTRPA